MPFADRYSLVPWEKFHISRYNMFFFFSIFRFGCCFSKKAVSPTFNAYSPFQSREDQRPGFSVPSSSFDYNTWFIANKSYATKFTLRCVGMYKPIDKIVAQLCMHILNMQTNRNKFHHRISKNLFTLSFCNQTDIPAYTIQTDLGQVSNDFNCNLTPKTLRWFICVNTKSNSFYLEFDQFRDTWITHKIVGGLKKETSIQFSILWISIENIFI